MEFDSTVTADSAASAIFSAAGVRAEQTPLILLVTARADTAAESNRFSGPWDASSSTATAPAAATAAAGVVPTSSLRDWLVARKLPLISILDQNNFDDLTSTGKKIVLAVVDANNKGSPSGAQAGKSFVDSLYPLARRSDFQSDFIFAQIDGPRYHKYVAQYGVPVTDSTVAGSSTQADTKSLPTLVVLEADQDYYFAPPMAANATAAAHPLAPSAVEGFLTAILAGSVPLTATLPWYNPSRYLKLLEKQMNNLPTYQLVCIAGGIVLLVVATLWYCCANGIDAAMGLQFTPEEEEQLATEKERVRNVAKKRDGGGKATAASAAAATTEATGEEPGLKQRRKQ